MGLLAILGKIDRDILIFCFYIERNCVKQVGWFVRRFVSVDAIKQLTFNPC